MTDRDSEIVARAEARLGTVLRGKYRLDRVLGMGGMAVVYKAMHRNQAEFAVKMLHPELSLMSDIRSRFLREGYAANSVKHPGAVLVVDDDVAEDGSAFLVMELLDGVPCDLLWERSGNRLSPHVASAIVLQLLEVLAAAHAKEIVHRDIKPANLFLTRGGLVKVLDFGIARARDALAAGAHATGTGAMLGTPAFMAPEQARGKSREVDARTDLWAAGATFFTLVSGQLVHDAETAHESFITAATEPARSIASVAQDVPPSLMAVVDRSLAFRREDRWQTAAEMRAALLQANRAHFGGMSPEAVVAAALGGVRAATPSPGLESDPAVQELARTALVEPPPPQPTPAARSLDGGSTTATPLSSNREPPPRSARRQRARAVAVGIAFAGTVGAGIWIARSSFRGAEAGGGALAVQPDRISEQRGSSGPASSIAPDAQPSAPAASITVAPVAPLAPVALAPPQPTTSHPLSLPAHPLARPTSTPPAPPKPNCDPNWYLESGIKKYKPECPLN